MTANTSDLNEATLYNNGRTVLLVVSAMLAFAANSVLCRLALLHTNTDPISFTLIRLISGAIMLWLILTIKAGFNRPSGSWSGAFTLFVYTVGFSYAYLHLDTGTGALLLFGAVQLTMLGYGYIKGERMQGIALLGFLVAIAGIIALLLPGASSPPPQSAAIMLIAGIAWAGYTLIGKCASDPLRVTSGNFLRALPLMLAVSLPFIQELSIDIYGLLYAIASGALASGVGYTIWYAAMRSLRSFCAATVQLSVPVLASLAGVLILHEPLSLRLALTSLAVLGGITLVLNEHGPTKGQ